MNAPSRRGGPWAWAVATLLAAGCAALAWALADGPAGLAYGAIYALATLPGWPIGFALFGRRHAAAWVGGALIGYALTSWVLWAMLAAGTSRTWQLVAGWALLAALTWATAGRRSRPLVALPAWERRHTAALLLVVALVPTLVSRPFLRIGEADASGTRYYRAYFTADFLWHVALANQLARGTLPPRNPYLADEPLHYYWTYFLVPSTSLARAPHVLGSDPAPWLLINATGAGMLFVAAIAVFAWCAAPGAVWPFLATGLGVVAASAEGAFLLWRHWSRGVPLDALRDFNVDAATMWIFRGLTIDGLPRSLWYTPQHAGACALGLVALIVAGAGPAGPAAALLAGVALAAAVTFSPFVGGLFALVYGVSSALLALRQPRRWFRHVGVAALAVLPFLAGIGAAVSAQMVEGAGGAVHLGWAGHARRAPATTLALALGPLLLPALAAVSTRRILRGGALVAAVGAALGLAAFFLVSLPERDPVWVGWRAGQLLLVSLPALAALGLTRLWNLRGARVAVTAGVLLLFAVGLPTTILDARNAQDVENGRPGPGFRWTIPVTRGERDAFDWLHRTTPPDAIVQPDSVARGRDTWTNVPTFGRRCMYSGLPISLLRGPEYDTPARVTSEIFSTPDAALAARLAGGAGIGYLWVGDAERAAHPPAAIAKFDAHPEWFRRVFHNDAVSIYVPSSLGDEGPDATSSLERRRSSLR